MKENDGGAFAERLDQEGAKGPEGRRVRATELTDFPWTRVCIFGERSEHDSINEAVGRELGSPGGRYRDRRLLVVFLGDGEPVISQVPPNALSARKQCFGPDAELVTYGTDPGPYTFLVEDGG